MSSRSIRLYLLRIFLLSKSVLLIVRFQESDTGLYISLTTFFGFGKSYVEQYYQKTNHAVFLHIQRLKTEVRFGLTVSRLSEDDYAVLLS